MIIVGRRLFYLETGRFAVWRYTAGDLDYDYILHHESKYKFVSLAELDKLVAEQKLSLVFKNEEFALFKVLKNKCSRYAYMTDEVATMLLSRQEQRGEDKRSDKIFKSDGISKTFERVVLELGFNENITDQREKVVFHTLRHTFASWHAKAGTPLYTISKLLGHKSITMTERYAHLCPDAEKKAAMTLQGVMDDTKGGKIIAFAWEASG